MEELRSPDVYRAVLEKLQTGVYLIDREQRIHFWNDGAEHLTGYLRQDVVGRLLRSNILALYNQDRTPAETESELASVLRDGKTVDLDLTLMHKDGHRIPVRLRSVPIRDDRGLVVGAAEHFDESPAVANWDRRQTKLATFGCLDEPSGALKRELVRTHVKEALETFSEHQVPFGILCIQIDRMNQLRASYGAAILPEVVRVAAQTLENGLRPADSLGRWKEDAFLAVLQECGASDVGRVAERLRKLVCGSSARWWGDSVSLSASFGGAAARPGDTLDTLIARAEKAVEAGGESNGNKVTVLDP